MASIDRRDFTRSALGAAAGWLALTEHLPFLRAFGAGAAPQDPTPQHPTPQDPQPPQDPQQPTRTEQLRTAFARARAEGKPLLLFVVPADRDAMWDRQLWFGAFLNEAGREALRDTALCVPACATVAEARAALRLPEVDGEPLMMRIDAADDPDATARAATIAAELPEPSPMMSSGLEVSQVKPESETIRTGIAAIAAALHRAMLPEQASIGSLASAAHARLTGSQQQALDEWFAGGAVPDARVLLQATAVVLHRQPTLPQAQQTTALRALDDAIDRELLHRRLAGSKWASSTGCGVQVEHPDTEEEKMWGAVACGMGHVPKLAARFLQFLADS